MRQEGMDRVVIFSRVIRKGFTDGVTFYKDLKEMRKGDLGIPGGSHPEEQPVCAPA